MAVMKSHAAANVPPKPSFLASSRHRRPPSSVRSIRSEKRLYWSLAVRSCRNATGSDEHSTESRSSLAGSRRGLVIAPLVALGASFLHSAVARSEDNVQDSPGVASTVAISDGEGEDATTSRIYDAAAIGEPLAIGKDRRRVWEKLMDARIVYLGEAEQVPVREDKVLELEIIRGLQKRCSELERTVSVALEAFPCNLQEQLDKFIDRRIDGEGLRSYTVHWPPQRWLEYESLLSYCRDSGIRLVACGTPLEVLRTVQAEGIRGLSEEERKMYTPPPGSGFISGFTSISRRSSNVDNTSLNQSGPFGPSSYLSAQARVVEDYSMSKIITQEMANGGSSSILAVIAGASHVIYGSRGTGLPARISKKLQKKSQAVILLNPERQDIRREGEVPVADFLWYSAARPCSRNCFDRAEIARIMNAAGRRRDALPQDLQKGLDLGLISPEALQNFLDLERYPLIAELTQRFQGFRERLLADPNFLHRLAIEEAISITTTLLAQYERRKGSFFEELDYVITDTLRGSVVDFFTVWLPAPTLSFLSYNDEIMLPQNLDPLKGLLGSIPDNAFQMNTAGKDWTLNHRLASVLIGGLKLSGIGIISSIGAVTTLNSLNAVRHFLNPALIVYEKHKRSPIFKSAVVYGCFLGTSANLRYQIIAGIVEHRISDQFLSSQPFLMNILSFIVRTINSYWGTQQWIDLARFTRLQPHKNVSDEFQVSEISNSSSTVQEAGMEDVKGQK